MKHHWHRPWLFFLPGILLTSGMGRVVRAEAPALRLNQIQVTASHNSYRLAPDPALLTALQTVAPGQNLDGLDYTHEPFAVQFDSGMVRGLELDIYSDPAGGLFSKRMGLLLLQQPVKAAEPELLRPGFKLVHIPDIDFRSLRMTFSSALRSVKAWSNNHPGHIPVFLNIESKTEGLADRIPLPGLARPVPFDAAACNALDAEVRAIFGEELRGVLTPAEVRGAHPTLEASVLAGDWPLLETVLGRVLFIMEGPGVPAYTAGHPSLDGRVMFTYSEPGRPEAAFLLRNNPQAADIPERVRQGYMVRTRADSETREARSGDTARRDAALASGAQIVSTDYYRPDARAGQPGWTDYQVRLPGDVPARPNPLTAADAPAIRE